MLVPPTKRGWALLAAWSAETAESSKIFHKVITDLNRDEFPFFLQRWTFSVYFRILYYAPNHQVYVVAEARSRDEIFHDWEIICQEYLAQMELVRSSFFSEHHVLEFLRALVNKQQKKSSKTLNLRESTLFDEEAKSSLKISSIGSEDNLIVQAAVGIIPVKNFLRDVQQDKFNVTKVDELGITPLHLLAATSENNTALTHLEQLEIAKALVSKNADLNSSDRDGWTPLHTACKAGNFSLVQYLIEARANLMAVTMEGNPAFSYLVRHSFSNLTGDQLNKKLAEHKKLLEAMLLQGVSGTLQNFMGESPLHQAAHYGHPNTVKYLIEQGAIPNLKNIHGETPLHYAARTNKKETVIELIQAGADPTIRGEFGTAGDVAMGVQHKEISLLLKNLPKTTGLEPIKGPLSFPQIEVSIPWSNDELDTRNLTFSILPSSASSIRRASLSDRKKTHIFQSRTLARPTWCEFCQGFIWGLSKQAFICGTCNYTVHTKCKLDALIKTSCKKDKNCPETPTKTPESTRERSSSNSSSPQNSPLQSEVFENLKQSLEDSPLAQDFACFLDTGEMEKIYEIFNAMDMQQHGYISFEQFEQGLGSIMNDKVLARALFTLMAEPESKERITFLSFVECMAVLMKGDQLSQLEYGFRLFGGDNGFITREQFLNIMEAISRSFGKMRFNSQKFIEVIFDKAKKSQPDQLSLQEFCTAGLENSLFIQSLCLLKDSEYQIVCPTPRRGIPIIFGHPSWELSWHMMHGIRLSVGEVSSIQSQSQKNLNQLDLKHFLTTVPYDFKNLTSSSSDPWSFEDYSPLVFYQLRKIFGVTPEEYMFSLGPEKLVGNLLLGNLHSLCEMISTGKSGSFFFRTNDSRYLLKTLPVQEFLFFQKILPSYYEYTQQNPQTFLTKFSGLHKIKKGKEKEIHFTVMGNLFATHLTMHEIYDLKGSTIGRLVKTNDPTVALKDLNFKRRLKVGLQRKAFILEQIERDIRFLESQGITDYSLLVGIHHKDESREVYHNDLSCGLVKHSSNLRNNNSLDNSRSFVGNRSQKLTCDSYGGMTSEDDSEVYFLTLIDLFTTYNFDKFLEHTAKSILLRYDSSQISAQDAAYYRVRFQSFVNKIFE